MGKQTAMNVILWLVGVSGILLFAVMPAPATDSNEHLWFNTGNYDSVRCVLYIDRSGSLVNIDSNSVTSFPGATLFGLWNDSSYQIQFRWYYNEVTTEGGMRNINYVAIANAVLGGGAGLYTVDFYLLNSADSSGIDGANVAFRDWPLTSTVGAPLIFTDANGRARLVTDEDSVAVIVTGSGPFWTFPTTWDSVTYSADYTDTIFGTINVPAATAGDNVTAYLDVGTGKIDSASGGMVPLTNVEYQCILMGGRYMVSGSWLIVPQTYVEYPSDSGRVIFTLPATTTMTPAGAYYELWYQAGQGRSMTRGKIRKFIVDTIPDPVDIMESTEVP